MSKDLRTFLDDLQERLPYDFVRIEKSVSPKQFEVTALLQHLENQKKFPVLFFEKPLDLNGKPSAFPLLSNVFATRQRCALSLGMKANEGDAPKARSWKSGFLKKGAPRIEIMDASNRLKLSDHVGHKVSISGMLADREMQARSLRRVSSTCE